MSKTFSELMDDAQEAVRLYQSLPEHIGTMADLATFHAAINTADDVIYEASHRFMRDDLTAEQLEALDAEYQKVRIFGSQDMMTYMLETQNEADRAERLTV